ncbi:hypothetical protein GQ44DRAFT_689462 [Phaeosphaeriaceae sp. PMI808]|nr:hypothetical protein GQ44DRAFT_689462 [Phaeosphaeriaceae sp. PMI808]
MSLPTSRCFVTQLLNSLPSPSVPTVPGTNPLSAVPEINKKQLLSLQVLFPNEFLPSLDLLDRGLVTRLRIAENDAKAMQEVALDGGETLTRSPESDDVLYYVRSAQQRSSRFSTSYDTTAYYEVRLMAWNCSCPAFAFTAFPAIHPEPTIPTCDIEVQMEVGAIVDAGEKGSGTEDSNNSAWTFGGISLGDSMAPICKHLLACVLVERCSRLFGASAEEKRVSVDEAAGWAAGWGD